MEPQPPYAIATFRIPEIIYFVQAAQMFCHFVTATGVLVYDVARYTVAALNENVSQLKRAEGDQVFV